MENAAPAPATSGTEATPAGNEQPGLMDTNFGRPSLDQIAANLDSDNGTPKQDFGQGNEDNTGNSVDDFMDREREMFRQRQELKVEREQFDTMKNSNSGDDYLNASDNDLDAMIDRIISGGGEEEQEEEAPQLSQDEMREQIKAELMEDFQNQNQEKEDQQFVGDYKQSIVEEISNSADFALTSSFGQSEMVYEVMEADFNDKAETYGEAYARDNMLSIKDSAQLVEKHLASQMKDALQSDKNGHLKNVLMNFLGNNQNQTSQDQQSHMTITPDITQTSNTPINEGLLTEEQRFNRALAAFN